MSTIFTSPGKLGDAILSWPVAHQFLKDRKKSCTLWLDEHTCKPLVPLFEAQPCVEKVELKPGILKWSCGGQPWDFGLKTEDFNGHEIHHLGFRKMPSRQI